MTINYAQFYCSVSELVADMQTPGADEALLYQKIKEASDYVKKEIGWFIPVTDVRNLDANERDLLPTPPITAVISVVNYGKSLVEGTDYLRRPEGARWPNGPTTSFQMLPSSGSIRYWGTGLYELSVFDTAAVVTTAHFGKYELSTLLGATVQDNPQTAVALTLTVNDGSQISPGMVLLIDSEQEAVTGRGAPVDSTTTLNGAIADPVSQVINVVDGTKVNIGEIIRLDFEQMKVLDKQTNAVFVTRGWNKTAATTHLTGISVYVYRAFTALRGMNGTTAAQHNQGAAINRYIVPDDILFLTKEIATLILNKSKSGYQGRTGNDQGVVFYNDAFPKQDVDRLKLKYSLGEF